MEMNEEWDVIIVGGGPAGLSAALMLGRACRRVLVVDSGRPRNRFSARMHGMIGSDGADPAELLRRAREELGDYEVTIRPGRVDDVVEHEQNLLVTLSDGESVSTRALIAASGIVDDLPAVPGLSEQWGSGVLQCPYCHGWEVRGRRLAVLGTSPMSVHQAELIRQWSDKLVFFTAGCGPIEPEVAARLRSRGVQLVDSPVAEILTDGGKISGALLDDGSSFALDAVFTAPVSRPHDTYLASMALEGDEFPLGSFISVDHTGRTSHPRIWAVGNVVNPPANIPSSTGAGSMTGGMVNMALVAEDFDRAVGAGALQTRSSVDEETSEEYWEDQYAESERRWSGRVNHTVAEIVDSLHLGPGHSVLDLGCGEGGDAVWLATQGWQVTAVDISRTATQRGAEAAQAAGIAESISWVTHDLAEWTTAETFDLVTASFFHSMVELPRTEILRRAAQRVRVGGHLLIVSHAFEGPDDIPPWALRYHGVDDPHDIDTSEYFNVLLTPAAEIAELGLDSEEWDVAIEETRSREAIGPDGIEMAKVKDGVVLLKRIGR